jgi:hypothetical protein
MLGAGYAAAGTLGLVVAADLLAVLAARPPAAQPAGRAGPGGGQRGQAAAIRWLPARWRQIRRRRAADRAGEAGFPSYRKIRSDLSWAMVSMRHHDLVVRPLLARLAGSELAQRHRIDLAADPERAERLVGADLWPLIDPGRPPATGDEPGPDLPTLTRIVARLEQL